MEAPVIMVGTESVEVERRLSAGELVCPCGGDLVRWGYARRRLVRGVGMRRPRRVRCAGCRVTHVLLSVACLLRRGAPARGGGGAVGGEGARGGGPPAAGGGGRAGAPGPGGAR